MRLFLLLCASLCITGYGHTKPQLRTRFALHEIEEALQKLSPTCQNEAEQALTSKQPPSAKCHQKIIDAVEMRLKSKIKKIEKVDNPAQNPNQHDRISKSRSSDHAPKQYKQGSSTIIGSMNDNLFYFVIGLVILTGAVAMWTVTQTKAHGLETQKNRAKASLAAKRKKKKQRKAKKL